MQQQMVSVLSHDQLCQQPRAGIALLDGLWGLCGCFHRAETGLVLADVLDHNRLCQNVFVVLAGFFAGQSQILSANGATFFRFRQIGHNTLTFEMSA
jgi:hypothetical protein